MRWAALAFIFLLALGGCAERRDGAGPVTLVFKHAKILGPADPVPGLLRRFEAQHPGVRVRSEALTWSSDEQHQFYVINLEGGAPPFDVMMLDVIWVPEFARAGWILDLTARVPAAERDAHFPSAIEPAVQEGKLWALPWFMNVGLLYYRADLLAKYGFAPPETYDELIRQAERIRAGEGDPHLDGYLWQGKQYEGGMVNVPAALWGVDLIALLESAAAMREACGPGATRWAAARHRSSRSGRCSSRSRGCCRRGPGTRWRSDTPRAGAPRRPAARCSCGASRAPGTPRRPWPPRRRNGSAC